LLGYGIPNFWLASKLLGGADANFPVNDNLYGVFPNPFVDDIKLSFYSLENQQLNVGFLMALGQNILLENFNVQGNMVNSVSLSMQNLQKGIYFVEISSQKISTLEK